MRPPPPRRRCARIPAHGLGLGLGFEGAGCRVQGLGLGFQGAGCRVQGAGCRVQGAGCRVEYRADRPALQLVAEERRPAGERANE